MLGVRLGCVECGGCGSKDVCCPIPVKVTSPSSPSSPSASASRCRGLAPCPASLQPSRIIIIYCQKMQSNNLQEITEKVNSNKQHNWRQREGCCCIVRACCKMEIWLQGVTLSLLFCIMPLNVSNVFSKCIFKSESFLTGYYAREYSSRMVQLFFWGHVSALFNSPTMRKRVMTIDQTVQACRAPSLVLYPNLCCCKI